MKNVCAIIVSYNPGDYLIPNIMALKPQVDKIVIVDNGSSARSQNTLDEIGKIDGVRVIRNNDNLGIAAALNTGIKYALDAGYDWVATFDQDSRVTPGFIGTMLDAYDLCEYKNSVAIISPVYCNPVTGKHLAFGSRTASPPELFSEIKVTMTSGNLLPVRIFSQVGLFDEDFFIDFVDVEFCLRCLSRGFRIIEAQKAILSHASGNPTQQKFLWKNILITHHNPIRRYYSIRNRVILWKRYFLARPEWVEQDMANQVKQIITIVLYEKDVIKKVFSIVKGACHGLAGKMGKYR